MRITFLGHAGFCVETDRVVLVCDPWLSEGGAFDGAWFPWPPNHHLAPWVRDRLGDERRSRYLYVSHEHKDHFDREFLVTLPRGVTVVAPRFRNPSLAEWLSCVGPVEVLGDRERLEVPGGFLEMHVDDTVVERDSAVLVDLEGHRFLNLNDCKLLDRVREIRAGAGSIDAFSCQFSGATWHPTCYEYDRPTYERISARKVADKYASVVRAIEACAPRVYLPAAGPACFYDPALVHLNTEPVNIFPRARAFLEHLDATRPDLGVCARELMPGDTWDATAGRFTHLAEPRIDDRDFAVLVAREAAARRDRILAAQHLRPGRTVAAVHADLGRVLAERVGRFALAEAVAAPLYVWLDEAELGWRVDFARRAVREVGAIDDPAFTRIRVPAWQMDRVLVGALTWEDLALTFRVRILRRPDTYDPALHAFLLTETEDLDALGDLAAGVGTERVVVRGSARCWEVDRRCPHAGGDLAEGWLEDDRYLVCPRHRWVFDLADGGRCTNADATVRAVEVEPAPGPEVGTG